MQRIKVSSVYIYLSYLNAFFVTLTSLLGIFWKKTYIQETANWASQALGQDIANILVVIVLIISSYYLNKKSLRAYFVWLGCYLYLLYAFAIYSFAIHFNYLFLVYVAILGLSFYVPLSSMLEIKLKKIFKILNKNKQAQKARQLLITIAVLFSFLWLSEIAPVLFSFEKPEILQDTGLLTNPVHVLDLAFILPGMIIVSQIIKKRKGLGLFFAVPFMVFAATMGIGIVSLFIVSCLQNNIAFPLPGYLIILIIGLSTYFTQLFLKEIKRD